MKFLFLLTEVEGAWADAPPGEGERVFQQYMTLEQELAAAGKLIASGRLRPSGEAQTVRNLPRGRRSVLAGPYMPAEEMTGGYSVLDCQSMEEALEWALRMPNYGHGSIEVRPFWE